ncbi:hypothetical protein H2204_000302 [Knufia peltigerae]|uniref:Protein kinase domain-containing protein n=1 Tax=Knufia peltigerae TaxID=1002370 RepID=A0AA38YFN2_9EURO|nr:hypothetical protein H2204_000302 [Knufia peltigerae]
MSDSGAGSSRPKPGSASFAIFHPEIDGYLHVGKIAAGDRGSATLVRSLADGQVYVRKNVMANHAFASNGACQEVEFYRHCSLPQFPRLLCAQAHQVFAEGALIGPEYKGASLFFEVCNGHTMERLADRADFKPSTLFIWRTFDQLLESFALLHRNGIAHTNAHLGNIFLHFPDGDAKLPELVLGGFGNTKLLSTDIWKDPKRTELKDDCDDRSIRPLLEDLAWIRSAMADLLSLSDPTLDEDLDEEDDDEDAFDVVEVLREVLDDTVQKNIPWGKHPREIYRMWWRFDEMIQGMLEKGLQGYQNIHQIHTDVASMRLREETRLLPQQVQDLRPLKRKMDQSGPSLRLNPKPKLFKSRTELESYAEKEGIRGPYRIAKIETDDSTDQYNIEDYQDHSIVKSNIRKISSIDIIDHGLFHADMWHMDVPVYAQDLLPILKERQKYDWRSWPDVVRLADKLLDGIEVRKESFCPFGRRRDALHGPVNEDAVNKFFRPDFEWCLGQTYTRSETYEILHGSTLNCRIDTLTIDDDDDDDKMSITAEDGGPAETVSKSKGKKRKQAEAGGEETESSAPVRKKRQTKKRETKKRK